MGDTHAAAAGVTEQWLLEHRDGLDGRETPEIRWNESHQRTWP